MTMDYEWEPELLAEVKSHFHPQKWEKMPVFEKSRNYCMLENHRTLLRLGLEIKSRPYFMEKGNRDFLADSSSSSDEDDIDVYEKQKIIMKSRIVTKNKRIPKRRAVSIGNNKKEGNAQNVAQDKSLQSNVKKEDSLPLNKEAKEMLNHPAMKQDYPLFLKDWVQVCQLLSETNLNDFDDENEFLGFANSEDYQQIAEKLQGLNNYERCREKENKKDTLDLKVSDNSVPVVKTYPKRDIPRVNYTELAVPEDDDFIFCDDCNYEWEGSCQVHGPLKHIQDTKVTVERVHPSMVSKIEKIGSGNSKRNIEDTQEAQTKKPKQMILNNLSGSHFVTQDRVDKLVVNYIIKGLHSFNTVERPEFKELVTGCHPGKIVMTRKTLTNRISESAASFKKELKYELAKISFVATTADCWKGLNRSYMGVTVHWIDPESLGRKMAVLACKRMTGRHTYDEIAKLLSAVNEEFAIQNKVQGTTTDNGSNFVKAFRVFHQNAPDEQENPDFNFIEVGTLLDEYDQNQVIYQLPPHERCAAHTLNLIATTDVDAAIENQAFKKIMRAATARCSALWKKQSTSTLHAVLIKEKIGKYFVLPNDTRWNSTFDALMCISKKFRENLEALQTLCDELGLPRFRDDDISFIHEYCKVMKPLAISLDTLQSETEAYMGILLPVLHALRRRLICMKESPDINICGPLLNALIRGVDKRFSQQWFRKDLVLASVLHPQFKFHWIESEDKEALAKRYLKEAVSELGAKIDSAVTDNDESEIVDDDDTIFDFKHTTTGNWKPSETQLKSFLNSSNDLKILQTLPIIKELFVKYNTCVPSSAAGERVFSVGGDIFQYKRGRLSDNNFENNIILKFGIK